MQKRWIAVGAVGALAAGIGMGAPGLQARESGPTVLLTPRDGRSVEGTPAFDSFTFIVDGQSKKFALRDVASLHCADPATGVETERITRGLEALRGKDRKAADAAAEELTDIGLPALSPLLAAYKDVDAREPDPLYRLFGRIIPGHADGVDRKLDLLRLANGTALRGKLAQRDFKVTTAEGSTQVLAPDTLRRLAVRRASIERTFDLQALRHCTYVGWLDTGMLVTPRSQLKSDAAGYVRLSFDEDGWACDPDGIADPLPGKRRMQEGFRWGAILARVGAGGERWLVGKHAEKSGLASGRLYFVVNDNEHWQNNIGSFRVRVHVRDAYDVGEPQ